MIKYTNRGLVNDRYYWNMNLSLLKTLFWVGNIALLVANQANFVTFYLVHGRSLSANTHRYSSTRLVINHEIY